jgi:hypothetical protein
VLTGLVSGLVNATVDGGLINDSALASQLTLTRQSGENVGSYSLNAVVWSSGSSGTDIANYTLPNAAALSSEHFQISPAALQVLPDNLSRAFGAADPLLTFRLQGLVNATVDGTVINDSALSAAQLFSGALSRNPGSAPGSYAIVNGTLNYIGNANYSYDPARDFGQARLTIVPARATSSLALGAAWGDLWSAFAPVQRPMTPAERDAHEQLQTTQAGQAPVFDGELVDWSIDAAASSLTAQKSGRIVLPTKP